MENWKLIQRYITGNITPQELQRLRRWMKQHPQNEEFVREVEQIWKLSPREDFNVDVEKAWKQFSSDALGKQANKSLRRHSSKSQENLMTVFRAAAVILVVLFAGLFSYQYVQNQSHDKEESSEFYVMQDLVTGKGEKARVRFSDGTEVVLNGYSSLHFPKKFNGPKREVYLDGEAFFKVAHDPGHPFIVHVEDTKVKVLGTEFNVRGWSEDSRIDVAVRDGKVLVNAADSLQKCTEVVLNQGQFTTVKKGEGLTPAQNADIENYLLWTNGGMYFHDMPLEEVLRQIERRFDVQIAMADEGMLDVPYTSTFRDAELHEILQVLAASMHMEYKRKGAKIKFY